MNQPANKQKNSVEWAEKSLLNDEWAKKNGVPKKLSCIIMFDRIIMAEHTVSFLIMIFREKMTSIN